MGGIIPPDTVNAIDRENRVQPFNRQRGELFWGNGKRTGHETSECTLRKGGNLTLYGLEGDTLGHGNLLAKRSPAKRL